MNLDDLDVVGQMWLEMTGELKETVPELNNLLPETRDYLAGYLGTVLIAGGFGFLAEQDGVVGFILGQVRTGQPPYQPVPIGYVDALYVRVSHRKQGLGRALLRSLGECFRKEGIQNLELHVHAGNQEAMDFWTRLEFYPLGFRLGRKLPHSVLDWEERKC